MSISTLGRKPVRLEQGKGSPSAQFSWAASEKNTISKVMQEVTVSHRNPKWVGFCIRETSSNSHILLGHDADSYLLLPVYALNIDLTWSQPESCIFWYTPSSFKSQRSPPLKSFPWASFYWTPLSSPPITVFFRARTTIWNDFILINPFTCFLSFSSNQESRDTVCFIHVCIISTQKVPCT